ncbi:MAG TPA: nucleotidyltransferase domain-containing protein [Mycobacteriales bacterium]|jgi:hypothetical protein|nr:nucleotidyltransferase domain-containing protein [Mycobacteriales bacterium]
MDHQLEKALRPLPATYHRLLDKVLATVEPDDRIRALWLSGSLARGVADAGSDLDLLIAVRDDALPEFVDGWQEWLATITPTIVARPLPHAPGSFYSTTVDCARLDVVIESVRDLAGSAHRTRLVVLDRDGLDSTVPQPKPPAQPDPERMDFLVEEYFRQLAIFPAAVVAREDWLLGIEGVHNARLMLYQLFVEANQPLPAMGVKQWTSKLTAAQRDVLQGLPAVAPTRDSVIAAMHATVEAFAHAGREALVAAGRTWPAELADAVDAGLRNTFASGPE